MKSSVAPGYTTSEFWLTLVALVLSVVGLVYPQVGDVHRFDGLVQAFSVLAGAIASAFYTHSRTALKSAVRAAESSERMAAGFERG